MPQIEFNSEWIGILLMPFTYGFVGWITNVAAIKMTFYPLNFVGIPPYLGWQGIVPKKAAKLALKSINIMTERLIKVEDFFSKVDPHEMEKEFQPVLNSCIPEATREILEYTGVLSDSTEKEKEEILREIQKKSSHSVEILFQQLKENVTQVFNFRSLVLRKLTGPNVERIVNIFLSVGSKEFKFIERCGWFFGILLGLIQVVIWLQFPLWWTLPIQGVIVGYITNWLALTMIFRPLYEKKVGPFKYRGLFLARQEEVSQKYSNLFATEVLTGRNVLEEILYRRAANRLWETTEESLETKFPGKKAEFHEAMDKEDSDFKKQWISEIVETFGKTTPKLETYMDRAMSIEKNMFQRMKALPPEEFEPILRSAFQEDEYVLILIGSALGAFVGLLQAAYMIFAA